MNKPGDVARKAQFLNMQQDGLKQRSNTFRNKKVYNRKAKHRNVGGNNEY